MPFRDPVNLYTPISNMEAHLICSLLADAGIEAAVVEDVSNIGVWMGGLASQLHKPKIMVERVDQERALPVIIKYEERAAERRAIEHQSVGAQDDSISVCCEACGITTQFAVAKRGSVQSCPKCLAYVDVGDGDEIEGWDDVEGES